jgi:hypothetical protein
VAYRDWPVPLRVDHHLGPLDLKQIKRNRSEGTPSVSQSILATGSGSEERDEMGGCSPGWLRVSVAGDEVMVQGSSGTALQVVLVHVVLPMRFWMSRGA